MFASGGFGISTVNPIGSGSLVPSAHGPGSGGTWAAPAGAPWAGVAPVTALTRWQLPRAVEQNQPQLHGALELL